MAHILELVGLALMEVEMVVLRPLGVMQQLILGAEAEVQEKILEEERLAAMVALVSSSSPTPQTVLMEYLLFQQAEQ